MLAAFLPIKLLLGALLDAIQRARRQGTWCQQFFLLHLPHGSRIERLPKSLLRYAMYSPPK